MIHCPSDNMVVTDMSVPYPCPAELVGYVQIIPARALITNKPQYSKLQAYVRYTGSFSAVYDRVAMDTKEIIGFQLN
jgi:hypothetical protein